MNVVFTQSVAQHDIDEIAQTATQSRAGECACRLHSG